MAKTLIIIDMQNDFITGGLGSEAAQNIVEPLCDYIKNFDGDIICTRDTHDWNYLNTLEGQNLPIEHCIENTAGWCIDDRILKTLRDKTYAIINKNHFGTLEWHRDDLRRMMKSEIEICGVCTDICVITNALILRTIYPEHKITVLSDLCAGTSEEHHKQALEIMYQCDVEVR